MAKKKKNTKKKEISAAYVVEGRSITTKKGIAHAGAKLKWSDLTGKTPDVQKAVFQQLLKTGYLEAQKMSGEIIAAGSKEQLEFETEGDESAGDDPPGDELPGDELPGDDPPDDNPPGDDPPDDDPPDDDTSNRKSGATRK